MADIVQGSNSVGRPSKLSPQLVTALKNIRDNEDSYVLFTDEELVEEINERLPKDKRISYPTFRNYKDGNYRYDGERESIFLSEFLSVLKSIRRKQKEWLTANMLEAGAGSWQKFGWIGERKFNDLNLTRKVDHTTDGKSFNQVKILDAEDAEYTEVSEED